MSVSHLPTVCLSVPLTLALSELHSTAVCPKRSAFLSTAYLWLPDPLWRLAFLWIPAYQQTPDPLWRLAFL